MAVSQSPHRKGIIGSPESSSFWLYDSVTGFDLMHPPTPTTPSQDPSITIQTNTLPVKISTKKSALVVIDMQNFFLSPSLGRPTSSKGLQAQAQLLQYAIPAARKAGIRIIWLNWGLTEEELRQMPPSTLRAFGFETVLANEFEEWGNIEAKQAAVDSHGVNQGCDKWSSEPDVRIETAGKNPTIYKGLGSDIGQVTDESGQVVQAGKLLMRNTWNADLTPGLRAAFEQGLMSEFPDVWIHKNRMSGMWGEGTDCTDFLEKEGIRTLLFAGVNTDQCVGGPLQDVSRPLLPCYIPLLTTTGIGIQQRL